MPWSWVRAAFHTCPTNPGSQVSRRELYDRTLMRRAATVGEDGTIICGVTLRRYSSVGAGAVGRRSVPGYTLVLGNPPRQRVWMSLYGHRLDD